MTNAELIKAANTLCSSWSDGTQLEQEHANIIRSLIALVPKDGYVVVPEEPTDAMISAGNAAWPKRLIDLGNGISVEGNSLGANVDNIYKAMLKAAEEEV